jgi:putative PIN family toxin of toxin-antitoxin system
VVACPAVLGEVAAVLGRERLRRRLSIEQAHRFVAGLAGVMTLAADPSPPYQAVCRDPRDDDLVALARAAVVDALVAGDRDLLELGGINVAVITPRELVERLADAG